MISFIAAGLRHVVNPVLEGLGQGEFIVWEEITAILGPYKVD